MTLLLPVLFLILRIMALDIAFNYTLTHLWSKYTHTKTHTPLLCL